MSGYIGASVGGVANAVDRIKNFTIASPTTVLTGLVYKPGYVNVTRNGVTLYNVTDYTATNGTSITLLEAAQAGDTVQVIARASFQSADTVSASAGGTFSGDVSVDADLSVDGNAVIDGNADIDGAVTVDGGITASGGIYLGGTGSDNLLDDYETGTWTPVIADASSGGNVGSSINTYGFYTKIGQQVTVNCQIINMVTTGMTSGNKFYIRGLPFTSSSTTGNVHTGAVRTDRLNVETSCFGVTAVTGTDSSAVELYQNRDADTDLAVTVGIISSGNADIFLTLSYFTNS